jgi:hypothetical protein
MNFINHLFIQTIDIFRPIVTYFYPSQIATKHEKQAKNVPNFLSTPSDFLVKTYTEQVQILTIDAILAFVNLGFIGFMTALAFNKNLENLSWTSAIVDFALAHFAMDFASSIVHLMLDNPTTKLHHNEIIKNCAIQFQDHHDKPYDNTLPPLFHILFNKSIAHNSVIFAHFIWQTTTGINYSYFSLFSFFWAVYSELGHRMCHSLESQRYSFVKWLMKHKLMITPEFHYGHHKTYDRNFATVSGVTEPFVWFISRFENFRTDNPNWVNYVFINNYIVTPCIFFMIKSIL